MSVQEEYELLEKIGTGSFGSVFLALQRASADRPERKVRAHGRDHLSTAVAGIRKGQGECPR